MCFLKIRRLGDDKIRGNSRRIKLYCKIKFLQRKQDLLLPLSLREHNQKLTLPLKTFNLDYERSQKILKSFRIYQRFKVAECKMH
jgi:hypothetical protein